MTFRGYNLKLDGKKLWYDALTNWRTTYETRMATGELLKANELVMSIPTVRFKEIVDLAIAGIEQTYILEQARDALSRTEMRLANNFIPTPSELDDALTAINTALGEDK